MNWKWIPCPNKIRGELCKGTIGFVPEGVKDLIFVTHPCSRCKAMAVIKIKNGELNITIFKKKMFAQMYPFLAQGEYRR